MRQLVSLSQNANALSLEMRMEMRYPSRDLRSLLIVVFDQQVIQQFLRDLAKIVVGTV